MGIEFSEKQQEQALEEYDKKHEMMYKQGKTIVWVIAIIEMISTVISVFIQFNLLSLIVGITLSVALILGVTWVRYLFAIGAGIASLVTIYILCNLPLLIGDTASMGLNIAFYVIFLIYSVASAILLFKSQAVSEYLYAQRNG